MSQLPPNESYLMMYSKSAGYLCIINGYRYGFKKIHIIADVDVFVEKVSKTGLCMSEVPFLESILPYWKKMFPDAELQMVVVKQVPIINDD